MFVPTCIIKIGAFTFNQVHSVRIIKSVEKLADTAEINLPTSALFGNQNAGFQRRKLEDEIKAGDPVSITLAYEGVFSREEFKGFVTYVSPNVPTLLIECEDLPVELRRTRINKNFRNTTLKKVLQEVIKETELTLSGDIPEVNFESLILKNVNGAQALQKIKSNYGLYSFIDDAGALYTGLKQVKNIGQTVAYDLDKNVISHDLKFRRADEVQLYVKVIGVTKDNKQVTVNVGDPDGDQRTLYKYNVSDPAQLKAIGEAALVELKYDGYEGTLTSFLIPLADRGYTAQVRDANYPDREGNYFVTKVVIDFGINGARRSVEIGTKL